jgi:hypothetical protein
MSFLRLTDLAAMAAAHALGVVASLASAWGVWLWLVAAHPLR